MHILRVLPPVLRLALSLAAPGQFVPLAGDVYDGAGGPLLTGTVYHTTSILTVPPGQTLTVQPGAIVKFGVGRGRRQARHAHHNGRLGPPGASWYGLGLLRGTTLVPPHGFVLLDEAQDVALLGDQPFPVGAPLQLLVPDAPILAGVTVALQTLTFSSADPGVGNTTELARFTFFP